MNVSQLSATLGSVAKLVAKDPLLGQGGEAAATGCGGVVRTDGKGNTPVAGLQ